MKTLNVDNKTIYIVQNLQEAEQLKNTEERDGIHFDWIFHGTPEHIDALRRAHEHHNGRADVLRKVNPDIHYEMDQIRSEIDTISQELERVTNAPVELHANFDKFGWSANIRTHNPDEPKGKSTIKFHESDDNTAISSSPPKGEPSESHNSRRDVTTMKIFQTPVLRQYFYNGILYRARDAEEIASAELFIDLLYVGLIAFNGDKTVEEPNGKAFLRFCVTFIPSWKIWNDVTLMISQYETDDVVQRVGILFILACLLGYTINLVAAFDSTYAQLVAFYVAARLTIAASEVMIFCLLRHVRGVMSLNLITLMIPTVLWITSIFVGPDARLALIWAAIICDLMGPGLPIALIWRTWKYSTRLETFFKKHLEYFPALNIEHKTERTKAFVSLVLGYSVVALLFQNQSSFGLNAFFGKAVLGLMQAYCFNVLYFDIDASYHHLHAIRRSTTSSFVWTAAHLPFIMGFTISGAALSRLVLTTDCANAKVEDLMPTYQVKSSEHIEDGIRWFYCCGLAIALISTAIISACHIHTPLPTQRIRKRVRLTFRCCVATVWILLPLAKSLNSLKLIAITVSMVLMTVVFEVYGQSCTEQSFFGSRSCRYSCSTSASPSRSTSRTDVATLETPDEKGAITSDENVEEKTEDAIDVKASPKEDETMKYLVCS